MGQLQSTRLEKQSEAFESLQNTFAKVDEENIEVTTSCLCVTRRTKRGQDWRKFMINQLNQVDQEEWPEILVKRLSQYRNQNTDNFYKNKVTNIQVEKTRRRISKTNNNSSFDYPSRNRRSDSINGSSINKPSNESPIIHSRSYSHHELDTEELNDSIKNLLEPSTILKEQLFPPEYPEAKQKNKNPSVIFLEGGLTSNAYATGEEISSSSSFASNNRLSAYKNNTILNQIGPAYRTGNQSSLGGGLRLSEMQEAVVFYKKVTNTIEDHLKEGDNVFCQMIRLFEKYFVNSFHGKVLEAKTGRMYAAEMVKISERATADLQNFIRIMCHTMNIYYNLQSLKGGRLNSGYTVFNYDNISNFTTTMIFTENIYKLIYEIYKLENYSVEKSYRKQLKQSQALSPEDYGVDIEYCLNRKTINYIRSKTGSRDQLPDDSPKSPKTLRTRDTLTVQETEEEYQDENSEDNRGIIKVKKVKISQGEDKLNNTLESLEKTDIPYEKCIQALKQLNDQKSPIHKLKIIMKVVDSITSSIEDFYKEFDTKSQQHNFGGDQNFSIFCYIVGKSNVKNLLVHCKIIQNFSTCNVMNSVSGYYTATLEACVRYLGAPSK